MTHIEDKVLMQNRLHSLRKYRSCYDQNHTLHSIANTQEVGKHFRQDDYIQKQK